MNKLSTVAFAAIFAACNSATTTDTGTQDSAAATDTTVSMNAGDTGWITLFDGTTLNGWHTFGSDSVGGAWGVDSSSIHLNSSSKEGRGDLVSNESYENFDLKLDWKISKAGNSGILFYVQDDKKKYGDQHAYQQQFQFQPAVFSFFCFLESNIPLAFLLIDSECLQLPYFFGVVQ